MAELGNDIHRAAALLRTGELVAIPTETVYGLAANALDEDAVVGIFRVKNRPRFDPLIVHVAEAEAFSRYADDIPAAALALAEQVCPGPVTFLFPKKSLIPDLVTSGHPTVGLRIPDHAMTLALLQALDFPLAAPSANPFGFVSPTRAEDVDEQLGTAIPYILDGGPCRIGLESTIIDFSTPQPEILRLGGLSLEFIEACLGQSLSVRTGSSNPRAPGMLSSHYNPGKPVRVGNIRQLAAALSDRQLGVLAFREPVPGIEPDHQRVLSPGGDLQEAARNFFGMLRAFNHLPVDLVIAEWLPEAGLGRAVNDRLRRAAAGPWNSAGSG
ncbi:MAG: threonylcarbamoyl-AMP synthase [Pseudomonadales bacterium]|nr:threonylcarbamoyl-AMP synthase [Pseudomonadales bacterium]